MRDRLHVSTVEVVSGKAHTFEITPNDSVLPVDHAVTGVKVAGQFRLSSVLSPESRKALLTSVRK